MIADSFSRLVLVPSENKALTLPEIVFGKDLGQRVAASKANAPYQPLLLFQPSSLLVVKTSSAVVVEDAEGKVFSAASVSRVEIPVSATFDCSVSEIELDLLPDTLLFAMRSIPHSEGDTTPVIEEMDDWPKFTQKESRRLEAVRYLGEWIRSKELANYNEFLRPTLKDIGRHVSLEGSILWKVVDGVRLEVLDNPERLREVLYALHEGLGHRQLRTIYKQFCARY